MTKTPEEGTSRRDFLKIAGTGAPAAAVAVVSVTPAEAALPDLSSDRLQDTANTRAYYDSARF